MRTAVIATCCALLVAAFGAVAQESRGRFIGDLTATMLDDGRNMRVKEPFTYVDSNGERWDVPAGTETDGASVPRAFWVAYPPFTGKYRRAAVVHDYYCQTQERGWKVTHNVFYDAMLASGVDQNTAKAMWAAVYYMGPRWGFGMQSRGPGAARLPKEDQQLEFMKRLQSWIERDNPSQDKIVEAMEQERIPK
jgi:Protein of unknown function (DUF1353)